MQSIATVREPSSPRGVYRSKVRVGGCVVYYAMLSTGALLCEPRVVWPGMSEAGVVADLRAELHAAEPMRPSYLRLVKEPAVRIVVPDLTPSALLLYGRYRPAP